LKHDTPRNPSHGPPERPYQPDAQSVAPILNLDAAGGVKESNLLE